MTQAATQQEERPKASIQGAAEPAGAIARSAFHLVLGQAAMTVLAIALNAALGRWLGPSDYGVLYFVTTINAFAFVVVDWGQTYYVVREVAAHPEKVGVLLGSSLAMRAGATALMAAVAAVVVSLLGYEGTTRAYAALIVALSLPTLLASSYSIVFRGLERMDYSATVDAMIRLLVVAVTVPALALGGRTLSAIVAQGAAGLGALAVAAFLYRRLGLARLRVTRLTARQLVVGGTPMVAMSLAIALQPNIDAILLSKLAPSAVVGWFGAARNFMSVLAAPAAILGTAAYPRLSRARQDPAQFRRELRAALRPLLVLGALGAVGTFFFADLAVTLVYGKVKYAPSIPILQLFAPAMLLIFIDMPLGGAILAAGKSRGFAIAKMVAVLLGTILDYLLIPICQARYGNGGLGVILSFGLAELVMITASLVMIPRGALDRSSVIDMGRALAAGALTFVVVRVLPTMPQLVELPVCIAVFALLAVALGLVRRGDLEHLRSAIRRRTGADTEAGT